jgi:proteic killer suppression protein
MIVDFEEEYLRELYEKGNTSDKKHRFQPEIIKGYARCIYRLQSAMRLEDLYRYNALGYEVLHGDKEGIHSIKVNLQYRVEFRAITISGEEITTICTITKLSNHYK